MLHKFKTINSLFHNLAYLRSRLLLFYFYLFTPLCIFWFDLQIFSSYLDSVAKGEMGSRGTTLLLSRASRIKQKLQSALEATALEVEDVSYQHAGHAAVRGGGDETHFNVKIVSPKFDGQSLVKRHRMVYDLLADELQSGLHAISIIAKTPKESGLTNP